MTRTRWLRHPLTVVGALLLVGAGGAFAAFTTENALAGAEAMLVLVATAGAGAGFANSGST